MKSHQTCEKPGMLPLCPDCRQRAENSCRWLQSPSWLWHTTKLAESKQTKAKLQHLYRLSESASAVELQFLYPAVSVSCFKRLCCTCHGQQIKNTVVPVTAQLHGCTNTAPSWFVSTGTGVMQPVMMSVLLHTSACLLSVLWAKEEKGGKIIHQKNFENVSGWKQRHLPKLLLIWIVSEVWEISNCHFQKYYT